MSGIGSVTLSGCKVDGCGLVAARQGRRLDGNGSCSRLQATLDPGRCFHFLNSARIKKRPGRTFRGAALRPLPAYRLITCTEAEVDSVGRAGGLDGAQITGGDSGLRGAVRRWLCCRGATISITSRRRQCSEKISARVRNPSMPLIVALFRRAGLAGHDSIAARRGPGGCPRHHSAQGQGLAGPLE